MVYINKYILKINQMSTKTNHPRKIKNLDNDRRAQNRKTQYFLKKGY